MFYIFVLLRPEPVVRLLLDIASPNVSLTQTKLLILAIPEALFTVIVYAVQSKRFDTDQAGYTGVVQAIIKDSYAKNISTKIQSQQIQMKVIQRASVQAKT